MNIRNVAIIAHVDHGKTTLVNSLFTSSHTFRDNEQVKDRMLDSNPIEAERGITIIMQDRYLLELEEKTKQETNEPSERNRNGSERKSK